MLLWLTVQENNSGKKTHLTCFGAGFIPGIEGLWQKVLRDEAIPGFSHQLQLLSLWEGDLKSSDVNGQNNKYLDKL